MTPKIKRPFIVYWNNIPSPYMVERFNALAYRGNLNFEAWFNERLESDRSWEVAESEWKFRYKYLPYIEVLGYRIRFPMPVLGRKRPDVLVSLYAAPVFLMGWVIAHVRGIRTAFWVERTFDTWVSRRPCKEYIKRQIFARVDSIITVSRDGRDYAMQYNIQTSKILFAPHTIDVTHFQRGCLAALTFRSKIRGELGLKGVTFIYVGRLWWGKGIRFLLDAFHDIQRRVAEEVSLLIVGDGEEEDSLKKKCRNEGICNVVFTGFKQKTELPKYYAVSDVFVFPTLGDPYGLVVDEAMACSLPVISTNAVGEIRDRVEKGVNGYIVPPRDSKALAEHMEMLVHNADLRRRMGEVSAQIIAGHTPERWAEDFERAVKKLMQISGKGNRAKARSGY